MCAAKRHVRFGPIATAKADSPTTSCPLHPQKGTCAAQPAMSAKGHKQTSLASVGSQLESVLTCPVGKEIGRLQSINVVAIPCVNLRALLVS